MVLNRTWLRGLADRSGDVFLRTHRVKLKSNCNSAFSIALVVVCLLLAADAVSCANGMFGGCGEHDVIFRIGLEELINWLN